MAYMIYAYDGDGAHPVKILGSSLTTDEYYVESAVLSEALNSAPTLTFSMYDGHPALEVLLGIVGYSHDDSSYTISCLWLESGSSPLQTVFTGRIFSHQHDDVVGRHVFTCEGLLARLNDYVVAPYSYAGTVAGYLQYLFNRTAGALQVGNVTVSDSNDYIVRSNENPSILWDEIADKCIGSSIGGYIEIRDGYIFDWLAEPSAATASQGMTRGVNLLGLDVEEQPRTMYSGVYIYGAEAGWENSKGQKQYYNLYQYHDWEEHLPSGFTMGAHTLWKDSLREQIGDRVAILHYPDITVPLNLMNRAVSFLNSQGSTPTIQVSALDMVDAGYGEGVDHIQCGQMIHVVGRTFSANRVVTAISRDLLDPSSTTFEFGNPDNITSAAGSEYGGGASTGGGASPTNFWHVYDDEYQQYYTGMSSLELDSILTGVASRSTLVNGGAVWLRYLPDVSSYTTNSYLMVRAHQLDAAFGTNSLFSSNTQWTMRAGAPNEANRAQLRLDGYSGDGYIKASDPYFHAGNGTNQAQLHLTPTGDVGVRTSVDSGNTWSEMEYIHEGGSGGGGAGIELIIDERTSAAAQLVGTSVRSSGYLENGLRIAFYLKWDTVANTTLRFTGSDSVTTTTYVYDSGLRQLGAKYKAGSVLMLTYIKPLPYKNYPDTTMGVWVVDADAADYALPTASATTLGGVKVGEHLSISDGVLAVETLTAQQVANLLTDD